MLSVTFKGSDCRLGGKTHESSSMATSELQPSWGFLQLLGLTRFHIAELETTVFAGGRGKVRASVTPSNSQRGRGEM